MTSFWVKGARFRSSKGLYVNEQTIWFDITRVRARMMSKGRKSGRAASMSEGLASRAMNETSSEGGFGNR